nr:MAG TPA: hypothetical protein [Caudoviricetes sp.]
MFIVVYYAYLYIVLNYIYIILFFNNLYKKVLKKRGDCGENIFIKVFRGFSRFL